VETSEKNTSREPKNDTIMVFFYTPERWHEYKMDITCTIKVINALMGSGKTSAAINMIKQVENSGEDIHFMFITPFNKEVERIFR
jgi:hypothetical protein